MTPGPGGRTGSRTEPSAAEVARTVLALWPSATLLLARRPDGFGSFTVDLEEGGLGRPVLVVDAGTPVDGLLRGSPIGTLALPPALPSTGPVPWSTLRVTARFTPARTATDDGRRRYRSALVAVCLGGARRVPVELSELADAAQDPLRHSAARIVDHLAAAHRDDLRACLRAQGREVMAVVPRAVDRYGLTLACLDADGVGTVRLAFPGAPPADDAALGAGWALPLRCACDGRRV